MDITTLTIWREACGEGYDGMLAVAWVIANRTREAKHWPTDAERVCLEPYQFSCWNTNDPGRKRYPAGGDLSYKQAAAAWSAVMAAFSRGQYTQDPTDGAQFYVNRQLAEDPFAGKNEYLETASIGRHTFYRLA